MRVPDFAIGLPPGQYRKACPVCARGPKDDALALRIEPGGCGVWWCHRCHARGGWRDDSASSRSTVPNSPKGAAHFDDYAAKLWEAAGPVRGIAVDYLANRGCLIPPADGDLRYAENLRHPSGYEGACLIALVSNAVTNVPMTLHRTWIRADGTKAPVDRPKLLMAGLPKAGGVIRLWPDEAITHSLAIAEGIESALAGANVHTPAWATVDAGNLACMPLLDGVETLVILNDRDASGRKAAIACGDRWKRGGKEVIHLIPDDEGADFADLAREEGF